MSGEDAGWWQHVKDLVRDEWLGHKPHEPKQAAVVVAPTSSAVTTTQQSRSPSVAAAAPTIYGVVRVVVGNIVGEYVACSETEMGEFLCVSIEVGERRTRTRAVPFHKPGWGGETKCIPVTVDRLKAARDNTLVIRLITCGGGGGELEVGRVELHLHDIIAASASKPDGDDEDVEDEYGGGVFDLKRDCSLSVGEIRLGVRFFYGLFGFGCSTQLTGSSTRMPTTSLATHTRRTTLFPVVSASSSSSENTMESLRDTLDRLTTTTTTTTSTSTQPVVNNTPLCRLLLAGGGLSQKHKALMEIEDRRERLRRLYNHVVMDDTHGLTVEVDEQAFGVNRQAQMAVSGTAGVVNLERPLTIAATASSRVMNSRSSAIAPATVLIPVWLEESND